MRYRRLDKNDDYTFGQAGQNFLVDSAEAVAQSVKTSLRLFQGEWFLDSTAGIPWITQVVGYGTQNFYDTIIKNAILSKDGVTEITSYSSSLNGRTLTVNASFKTRFGPAKLATTISAAGGYGTGGYGVRGYGL